MPNNTTVYTNNQYYQDIARAIRNKNGQSTLYKPSEMAPAINAFGSNLDFLASNTNGPSVRKFFYALQTGAFEHGEFTLTSTPTNAFVDLFTMTNFSADNPPQGIIIIDKDFYEGATLPHNSSEAVAFLWFDKAFVSPGKDDAMTTTYPYYGGVREQINKTTTSGVVGGDSATIFNGTDDKFRGYYLFNNNKLTWKSRFGGQQYTTFIANRPYIWMVY